MGEMIRALGVALVVVATAGAARGGPPSHPSPAAQAEVQNEALRLFKDSVVEYRAGRFAAAAGLLRRAYALVPRPVLLYNLARADEGMGELEPAIAAYRAYLEGDPTAPDRMSIEARIITLEQTLAERRRLEEERRAAVARAEAEAARRRAADRVRKISPAPWILAGAGVLGLGIGVGLAAAAQRAVDGAPAASSQADAAAEVDRARRFALGANVALGLGAALAIAGAAWGLVDVVRVRRARTLGLSVRLGVFGGEVGDGF